MTLISIYPKVWEPKTAQEIELSFSLDCIKNGKWQDICLKLRNLPYKSPEFEKLKKELPALTVSGLFKERNVKGLIKHSGFICVDFDGLENAGDFKEKISKDAYTYAAFISCSGKGVAVLVKIDGKKHLEAFLGLQQYYFQKHEAVMDVSCKDVSRARFVSYDPYLYLNESSEKFQDYVKLNKERKVPTVVFVQNDFDLIVKEIVARRINIAPSYHDWLRCAFALADHFGEDGRRYLHQISDDTATPQQIDKQFDACLKAKGSGVTIATIYYFAKEAGIKISSEKTDLIVSTAHFAKKGKRNKDSAIKILQEQEGISPAEAEPIVNQVFDNNPFVDLKDSFVDNIYLYLSQNHEFRRNSITRYIEDKGKRMEQKHMNTIFLDSKKIFEKASYEIVERIINSTWTPDFNPLLDFFDAHKHRRPKGVIESLFNCIETDTGFDGNNFYPNYKIDMGRKWLVGMIASIHGQHSPLMLVLAGCQNSGKTYFFRNLLPDELKDYYAESKLDAGKDDEILMTQKLIIMDDEMGGKSKAESKRLKELTSKQVFTLREPYGRSNVDLRRLAVLCGTTNDTEILNDPTGNRRIIPINVLSINHDSFNKIDKTDLIMEAYWLYKDGFDFELRKENIIALNQNTEEFEATSAEKELIKKYFSIGVVGDPASKYFQTTEVKVYLEKLTNQRLSLDKIGKEMKSLGYDRTIRRINGIPRRVYFVTLNQIE